MNFTTNCVWEYLVSLLYLIKWLKLDAIPSTSLYSVTNTAASTGALRRPSLKYFYNVSVSLISSLALFTDRWAIYTRPSIEQHYALLWFSSAMAPRFENKNDFYWEFINGSFVMLAFLFSWGFYKVWSYICHHRYTVTGHRLHPSVVITTGPVHPESIGRHPASVRLVEDLLTLRFATFLCTKSN